ncbi:MAG: CrcB family protein [Acidimicrobiia bacterium]
MRYEQPTSSHQPNLQLLGVIAGGLLGAAVRVVVASAAGRSPAEFPWATLTVNLSGAFLLGAFLARWRRAATAPWAVRFWAIGALGAMTTFSAFSLEVVQLLEAGRGWAAAIYVVASTAGGLLAALGGDTLGRVR